jgi:hypothetical protein
LAEKQNQGLGYANYLAEKLTQTIGYAEHSAEHADNSIRYSEYLAENAASKEDFKAFHDLRASCRSTLLKAVTIAQCYLTMCLFMEQKM